MALPRIRLVTRVNIDVRFMGTCVGEMAKIGFGALYNAVEESLGLRG